MKKQSLWIILSVVGLVLLIPLIAMKFSTEVNWSFGDFLLAGGLLLGAGLAIEWALRSQKTVRNRAIWIVAILGILLLIWAELAVGLFDFA
ncbi:hypothetical protein [Pontibacter sp. G13]|uniref:hypothetical protein n=1 Tax=Pontibacter sp. G13 TaxID=3074898 RepID=UPI0028895809|nr:hypothetical protein [Pontibacter sp. G13]WNJ19042.1 hypothetical protein RJD25_01005 [Pontibacter sp. G13]